MGRNYLSAPAHLCSCSRQGHWRLHGGRFPRHFSGLILNSRQITSDMGNHSLPGNCSPNFCDHTSPSLFLLRLLFQFLCFRCPGSILGPLLTLSGGVSFTDVTVTPSSVFLRTHYQAPVWACHWRSHRHLHPDPHRAELFLLIIPETCFSAGEWSREKGRSWDLSTAVGMEGRVQLREIIQTTTLVRAYCVPVLWLSAHMCPLT